MSDNSRRILIIGSECAGMAAVEETIRLLSEKPGKDILIMTVDEAVKNGFGDQTQMHLGEKEPFFIEHKPIVIKQLHQHLDDPIVIRNDAPPFYAVSKRGRKKGRNKRW